jgi:hypothetical protein
MGGYGQFLVRVDRPAEAEAVFRQALDLGLETVGPDHPRVASILSGLADALAGQGELVEADSIMTRALDIRAAAQGRRVPIVALTMAFLADIKTLRGLYSEAEGLLKEAWEITEDQPSVGEVPEAVHAAFSRLYDAWGRPEDAALHKALAAVSGS